MEEYLMLPENSLACSDCLDDKYVFSSHCLSVFQKMAGSLARFDEKPSESQESIYFNNVIGILGGRGSGKSSIVYSVFSTLKNPEAKNPFFASGCIVPIEKPIDPKCVPGYLGVVDCVLGSLYSFFLGLKDLTPDDKNFLRAKFNDASFHVSNLSLKKRRDVIENPSDLYDIMRVINIRTTLEELVKNILDVVNKSEEPSAIKKSFLLCIDDFDLDSSRCRQMATEITTFLTVRGLIILLAMDPYIFDAEIERARISELSDLGQASTAYLNARSSFNKRRTNYEEISEAAIRYREQFSDKLIPYSMRVYLTPADLPPKYKSVKKRIFDFLYEICGIDFRKEERIHPFFKSFYRTFSEEFYLFDDIRTRNQVINRLLSIPFSSDQLRRNYGTFMSLLFSMSNAGDQRLKNTDGPKGYLYEIGDSAIDILGNQLDLASKINTLHGIRNFLGSSAHDYLGIDDSEPVLLLRFYGDFFQQHPVAYLLYESFANYLDVDDENFAEDFVEGVNSFGDSDFCQLHRGFGDCWEGDGFVSFENKGRVSQVSVDNLVDAFRRVNLSVVTAAIDRYIRSSGRDASMKNLNELASWINEYLEQGEISESDHKNLKRYMSTLESVIARPWRTAQDRAERKAEANSVLRHIKAALHAVNARKN